ncbi:transglycosylase domain-containing protein [Kribbella sp. NBC_01245]|uniref:penicillin-binding protein n=1 Tax=Kribbella sp. NBC_01245 TaxID=2903578 RepID=UPI002E29A4AE|nr:transglycosylase domain-containing protein [Kribbella sp. NBC_01245]
MSVLSGALAAGLAIPFAGLAGFGTQRASETFEQLPQELKVTPPPVRSTVVGSDGKPIANLFEQNRVILGNLSDIAPIMKQAIISIEDYRFYEHGALDAKGTLRALMRNQTEGSVQQGGSSITQQYVKLVLLQQADTPEEQKAATAETYERKIRELRYAVAVEKQYSKDEILLRYLNLANFGDGAYGVEAAARHYFKATAKTLTLPQAALLAGIVKSPSAYNPTTASGMKRAKERRDVVLRRMQELKVITPKQAADAIKTPVIDKNKVQEVPKGCASSAYPFYCEYVYAQLLNNPALGKNPKERADYIKSAGLKIRTSLDRDVQNKAQAAISANSQPGDQAMAAMSIVEPGTGLVKAMVQSRPYGNNKAKGETTWNYNVEASYGSGFGGFQPGSTMKAFVLAAAIQQGIPLNHMIDAKKTINLSGARFRTCNGVVWEPKYTPKNSTISGPMNLIRATAQSVNTYFLLLSKEIGLCGPSTLATKLGVVNAKTEGGDIIGKPLKVYPSYTLGVGNVTPLMMANAYATFAARGKYCTPVVITSITDSNGKNIPTPGGNCTQVMQPDYADGVNRVMQSVMTTGGTGSRLNFGRPVAGKTGTTSESKAVWFVGYTPTYAAAVGITDPDGTQESLTKLTFNGRRLGGSVSGGGTAGPIWEAAMRSIHEGLPEIPFRKPDSDIVKGDVLPIPRVTGMSPDEAVATLKAAGFNPEVSDERRDSDQPEGTVAYTSPRRSDGAIAGATIIIYLSNGKDPNPLTPPPTTTTPPPTGKPTTKPTKPGGGTTCPPWRPKCNER